MDVVCSRTHHTSL